MGTISCNPGNSGNPGLLLELVPLPWERTVSFPLKKVSFLFGRREEKVFLLRRFEDGNMSVPFRA